jgi:DNA ligase (NAD+)
VFYLTKDNIINLERFADKSATNLIEEIERAKNVEFERFINALSIKHVGQRLAQILAEYFDNLEQLSQSTYQELIDINTVGPEIAESVVKFFNDERNKNLINKFFDSGINLIYQDKSHKTDKLYGLTFVLTGTLDSLSRDEAKKLIEQNGGKVTSSISKKTSFVVVGANPGSKLEKAEKLDLKILNENSLKELLN